MMIDEIVETVIDDWRSFVHLVNEMDVGPVEKINYIFRGQADSAWELKSSFHRIVDVDKHSATDLIETEREAHRKFITQAHQFLPANLLNQTTDIFGWWALMQHYGAPTRLLDWSCSPYVAAYNACIEHYNTSGTIWVLHTKSLIETMKQVKGYQGYPTSSDELDSYFFDENAPSIVIPLDRNFKTDRMVHQQGIFTVSQNVKDIQHNIISNALPKDDGIIKFAKIIIPAELKIEFLRKLHQMNVSANSLFPGIDGLGKSISEYVKIIAGQIK